MSINYSVVIEYYAERHFIKKFKKKYKKAWDVTLKAMVEEMKRLDSALKTEIAEDIFEKSNISFIKTEFRVAGTKQSRKASGNRCIVAVHNDVKVVYVLLVYHKNDLKKGNETVVWKQMVKDNYKQYKNIFKV